MKKRKENYENMEGVWRTIGGRRVFIKTGQSLSDAMKESGKFKKQEEKDENKWNDEKYKYVYSKMSKENQDKINQLEEDMRKNPSQRNVNEKQRQAQEIYEQQLSDTFEVGDLKRKALETLPKDHIDSHEGDLYIKKTPQSTELLNRMKDKDSGLLSTFKDQQTGEEWYDIPFANWEDDYKEKYQERYDRELLSRIGYKTKEEQDKIFADREGRTKRQIETDWREQIKKNNEQMEKDLDNYKKTHNMAYQEDGYYEIFRENERRNAKIKKENPTEPYEYVSAYAGYHDKSYKLAGTKMSGKDVEEFGTKSWTGKEYTNDEFMEHLEDSNWHSERKALLEAGLTNQELSYIKDRTTLSQWSVGEELTGSKNVEKMIKEAKSHFANNSNNLMSRYSGTVDYLKQTTNMSGNEILELLKKIEQDKK